MMHPVLKEQLDRLGLTPETPPDPAQWQALLTSLNHTCAALHVAIDRQRALFQQTNDAVFMISLDGYILEANSRASQLLGYPLSEIVGKTSYRFVSPRDVQSSQRRFADMVQNGSLPPYERLFIRADGTEFISEVNAELVRDALGQPLYIQSIVRDISERKAIEAALRRSEQRLTGLLAALDVGVIVQGPQSEIILSNPSALRLLGLTHDQLLGKTSFDPDWNVIHEDGSTFPGPEHPVPQAIQTGKSVTNIVMGVYRPALRDRVWLLVNAQPVIEGERVVQVICTFSDITERKHAEDREQELQLHKSAANKLQNLLQNISHDLRTPLSVINTSLYLARKKLPNDHVAARHLDTIDGQVNRLKWMADEASDLIHLEDEQAEARLIMTDLVTLTQGVLIKSHTLFEHKRQTLFFCPQPEIPAVMVDRIMLSHALENLLLNAHEFTPPGGRVDVLLRHDTSFVRFVVSDNGIGIEARHLPHIFEPLYKADEARSKGGSGLGLAVTQRTMEAHGGRVTVESEPGRGSTFTLWLPVAAVAQTA